MDIIKISEDNRLRALTILESTRVIQAWEDIGATVKIVGSLKTGLMMNSKDIDLHIYTDNLSITESFSVISRLAENLQLKEVIYKNLIETEEECMEWHVLYDDENGNTWKFDMIHILRGSKYDGVVEKVADRIISKLTPELRKAILEIKYHIPENEMVPGIEIYYAVFTAGIRTYPEFIAWYRERPLFDSLEWMP